MKCWSMRVPEKHLLVDDLMDVVEVRHGNMWWAWTDGHQPSDLPNRTSVGLHICSIDSRRKIKS
jgi:hypothetical protein